MISHKAHSLLSDLHAILANYEAEDFLEAARFSPELALALKFLSKKTGLQGVTLHPDETNSEPLPPEKMRGRKPRFSTPEEIVELLARTPHSTNSTSVLALSKRLGIPLKMNPKDGKSRLLRRLAGGIASLEGNQRSQALAEIVRSPNSQTQGWVDVLKGR